MNACSIRLVDGGHLQDGGHLMDAMDGGHVEIDKGIGQALRKGTSGTIHIISGG